MVVTLYIAIYIFLSLFYPCYVGGNETTERWILITTSTYFISALATLSLLVVPNSLHATNGGWCELRGALLFWNNVPIILVIFLLVLIIYLVTIIKYVLRTRNIEFVEEKSLQLTFRLTCFLLAYFIIFSGDVIKICYGILYSDNNIDNPPYWISYLKYCCISSSGILDMAVYGLLNDEFRNRFTLFTEIGRAHV